MTAMFAADERFLVKSPPGSGGVLSISVCFCSFNTILNFEFPKRQEKVSRGTVFLCEPLYLCHGKEKVIGHTLSSTDANCSVPPLPS